ncbi:hypothetical protein CEXT_283441 [Caerostris extrusa]|uniref:C2H2-type domain-containing protein n=1 Tax=Caerostris extrusa TaxID=172846 RepID=A0AAV4Y7C4_CAEEX|nr:hypothetical protein CEXT_283441 [Caerostris extrusa]
MVAGKVSLGFNRHHFPGSSSNYAASVDPLASASRRNSPCETRKDGEISPSRTWRMINYTLLSNAYSPNKPPYQCPTCPRAIQRLGCRLVGLSRGLGSHRRQKE